MGILLIFIASLFVATTNLTMRKSMDGEGGSSKAYLMVQLTLVFVVAILLNPVRTGEYTWSHTVALFGLMAGIVLVLMLACLSRSLEFGPPGLTFAILNASTVVPILVMVLVFGQPFGFIYTPANALGSIVVIAGLLWAGYGAVPKENRIKWLGYILSAFVLHALFLVCMQWRALLINFPGASGLILLLHGEEARSTWFMPMVFCSAALIQTLSYLRSQKVALKCFEAGQVDVIAFKKGPQKSELLYGFFGGIANGIGTFFLIWATEVSTEMEHAMLFPIFSVTIIAFCNLWSQLLYREKVNWSASIVCMIGLLIGTLDWKSL